MVLLRIRVYPEPVRSRKLCHKWSIFPCYSATAWVPFGQCIHFLLDPYSPSFYSLYIPKRVARKNHEQALRHPPPFHCFARPLAGGGGICARFSRAPNKRVGPFQCAGIHPASPHRRYALRVPTRMLHPSSQKLRRRTRAHIWRRPPLPLFLL